MNAERSSESSSGYFQPDQYIKPDLYPPYRVDAIAWLLASKYPDFAPPTPAECNHIIANQGGGLERFLTSRNIGKPTKRVYRILGEVRQCIEA